MSDDGGLNWARLNPAFAHDVRAIDLLPDEAVLALGPDGLFLVTADSIRTLTDSPALSLTDLNPAAVQQTSDGDILIGRHAGPGLSLWVYDHTSSAWHQATVGEGRGISAIEAFSTPRAGMAAVIATDGDGLFGWSPGGLSQFPALLGADGQPLRIGALLVSETGSDCSIIVGTVGPARIVSRPCDLSGAWDAPLDLMTRAAQQVGGVSALIRVGSRMFAATSEGFFRGTLAGPWQPIFGLPTRPLALAAPADYELSRTLVAGGPQSGPILLFDSAPDIDVRLECPTELLGDTSGTCTATLTNQGLLPIPAGSLAVQLSGSSIALIGPAEVAYPQLETGSLFSTTLTLAVARDARPGKAHLDVTAPAAPAEGFTANNHIGTSIQIAYRNGADPAIVIGGQTMTRPTTKARLNLTVSNGGTLAMGAPARLSLTLPDNVLIDAIGDGALVSPGVVSWDVPDLEAGERIVLPLTYHLAADVQPDNILTVTATLLPQGDDREPTNNGDVAQLQLIPAQPIVLALTNMTRLARRGPVTEARAELASYLADAPGIEIPLDAAPPCETNHSSLACYYD
ncbi:MAG: hypothetical protein HGA65_19630, partial [Oscillochloris sp.]|nr:hypothetical protein [Oscillochloris sp.]